MNNCCNLYLLSSIACQLSECLTEDEIELLAANLKDDTLPNLWRKEAYIRAR